MTAIVTDNIKRLMIQDIYDDLGDSDASKYYICVGHSQQWNDSDIAPDPVNTDREIRDFRLAIQSMKRVADYSFAVPRNNWSSGTIYSSYSDSVSGHPTVPYYVLNDDNGVYICLEQGRNAAGVPVSSTVKPTGALTEAFTTVDGYTWKFLYTVGTLSATKFLSANFMPVKFQETTDGDSLAVEVEQETIQNAAVPGQVTGVDVFLSGSGYTSSPTVEIIGDGTGARALATLNGGVVTKIDMDESDGEPLLGSGYTFAEVRLTGGGSTSAASARVKLSPRDGFGADPRVDLRSTAIMFNIKPEGDEAGAWLIDNSFRQIGVIRNPKLPDSDGLFNALSGNSLRRLQMQSISSNFNINSTLTGGTSGAKAFIDKVDSDEIWYHQTEALGFTQFQENEAVTDADGGAGIIQTAGADADADAYVEPSVDPFSGELLYIENRAKIDRAADQTEDIKVIIEI
jgi:hypothetical protein